MITVLSIVPYKIFPPKVGGQKGIAIFNQYLSRECKLLCVTVRSNNADLVKDYQVINMLSDSPSRYINFLIFYKIKSLIRRHNVTHVILEHPYFGWLGILLKWSTGAKLVIHSHNIESTRWKSLGKWWWKILYWYEKTAHKSADYNFFIHDDDRNYAIDNFNLKAARCATITYGIEANQPPGTDEKKRCKGLLKSEYGIADQETIFLFNGALDYRPNFNAVKTIIDKINPILLQSRFPYKIIICGRGLPGSLDNLKMYAGKNIIYAGFVDDITVYFKGCDVFINPVVDGGGIKTKLVESLGFNTKAVSTKNGSVGVGVAETDGQLVVVPDYDWDEFARQMVQAGRLPPGNIPRSFYEKFYWGNIAGKAADFLKKNIK